MSRQEPVCLGWLGPSMASVLQGGRQDAGLVHVNNSQQFTPWSLIPSTCWYLGSGNPPPMIPEPGSLHYHSPFV